MFLQAACLTVPNVSITTEMMDYGSLYDILHDPNFETDIAMTIKFAIDITDALICLHCQDPPILHCNLKSSNILVRFE